MSRRPIVCRCSDPTRKPLVLSRRGYCRAVWGHHRGVRWLAVLPTPALRWLAGHTGP